MPQVIKGMFHSPAHHPLHSCPNNWELTSVVLISVVGWGPGLLVLGFIPLLTGQVSVSVVVAESWPVLVALATD